MPKSCFTLSGGHSCTLSKSAQGSKKPPSATGSSVTMPPRAKKPKPHKHETVIGELRDLPTRSMAENEAKRQECFACAWAQKAAREAAGNHGAVFVSEWPKEAVAKSPTPARHAHKSATTRKIEQPKDSDSD